jgi:phospholipid/cholesterol/gamma-HCH transport system substrate-binding protein
MRTTNLVIGTTTLAVFAAMFAGLLAVQKVRAVRNQSPLRIVFDGSASGLHKGGGVNFDGVQAGQIMSIKLENPRKIVAMVMLDNSAPIRKDTAVGIEFQGLTGIAAISLIGGAGAAGRRRHPRTDRRSERAGIHYRHPAQCRPRHRQQSGGDQGCAAVL